MKSVEQFGCTAGNWIDEKELPIKANLKVIRRNDPDYGLSEDEIHDRNEFIRCHLLSEFELLTMIPKRDRENDFFIADCAVDDPEYSAFNTVDFQKAQRPFNKYAYAMKKIMERVKELAIMHSSISDEDGRRATYQRYEALVDREFRHRLLTLADRHKRQADEEKRYWRVKEYGRSLRPLKIGTVESLQVGTLLVPESGKMFSLINFWLVASFFPGRKRPPDLSYFGQHRAWR